MSRARGRGAAPAPGAGARRARDAAAPAARARLAAAVAGAWLAALPAIAHACAACGVGNGRNTMQFWWTTVVLSLLPLGLLAAGIAWIARHGRAFIAAEFRESDEETEAAALPAASPAGGGTGRSAAPSGWPLAENPRD